MIFPQLTFLRLAALPYEPVLAKGYAKNPPIFSTQKSANCVPGN
jgi:hypothetical protein